tara:strand:- start:2305 stop:2559 length:255 start_codon:yes stop_codon:yes gene_type:complete
MARYKNVNEGLVDRFISTIFTKVGKGLESATLKKLKKSDPELAKDLEDLQKTKKDLEKRLSKKSQKAIASNEIPPGIEFLMKQK